LTVPQTMTDATEMEKIITVHFYYVGLIHVVLSDVFLTKHSASRNV